jgi:hypothetical protein
MAQPLGNISLDAAATAAVNASFEATIDPIAANITIRARNRDGIGGWWVMYINALLAEREAARLAQLAWREKHAVEGDGWFVMEMPIASGQAFRDPDAADAEFIAALLPWLRRAA